MDNALFGALLGAFFVGVWWLIHGFVLTNDAATMIYASKGNNVIKPFNRRVFFIWLLKITRAKRGVYVWAAISQLSLVGCSAIVGHFGGPIASLLFCTLAWYRQLVHWPCMTDALSMFLSLAAMWLWGDNQLAALAVVLIGSFVNERVPVFSALFCWHPLPLVALIVSIVLYKIVPEGGPRPYETGIVDKPIKSAIVRFRQLDRHPVHAYILGWGAALFAFLVPSAQLLASVAVSYSQLFVAVDRERLFMWASPVMCIFAAQFLSTMPPWLLLIVIALHISNPLANRQEKTAEYKMELE